MRRGFLLFLLPFAAVHQAAAAEPSERNVVVISIDGLPGYLLDDPEASLPVIRGLRDAGVAASEGMIVTNPSVTWPNHTTLMTGVHPEKHGVIYNGLPERHGEGKPITVTPEKTQQELVRVPFLFDFLKEKGISSAAINWPCTAGSASLVDNFPDVPNPLKYTNASLKDELSAKGILQRFEANSGVVHDEVWTEAACQSIKARKPRLLALHLLNVDSTHHRFGPKSAPGYTAVALTDALVGRVLDALDEARVREKTTVFVVSDHGFIAIKKTLKPNAILRKEGLLQVEGNKITSAKAHVIPEGGTGMIYLTDPSTAEQDRATVRKLFEGAEGIVGVLGPDEFARHHYPLPGDHPAMADLVLVAKEGYTVNGSAAGDEFVSANPSTTGSHGFLATEPKMNALFVAAGAGIKPGVKLATVDNVDLAPTAAKLLGSSLDQATGRVLSEILEEAK